MLLEYDVVHLVYSNNGITIPSINCYWTIAFFCQKLYYAAMFFTHFIDK